MHGAGALRVMGVPFGMTDSATRLIWWNQAMNVCAIEWLMANEEIVRNSATSPLGITDNSDRSMTVDAGGQPLITAGIAAFDVACAEARVGSPATVHLVNTVAVEMANYFLSLGRQREINTTIRVETETVTFHVGGQVARDPNDEAMLEDALKRGVVVETSAATKFLDRGRQIWVRTSERSRAQGSSITDISPRRLLEQR